MAKKLTPAEKGKATKAANAKAEAKEKAAAAKKRSDASKKGAETKKRNAAAKAVAKVPEQTSTFAPKGLPRPINKEKHGIK